VPEHALQLRNQHLTAALRQGVLQQGFAHTADSLQGGRALGLMPAIDLALVVFDRRAGASWANLLFSPEYPQGVVADMAADASAVRNIRFDADLQGSNGESVAWLPGSDWAQLPWRPLHGLGPHRFVTPYPASLLKLMVAVGVALAVDEGLCAWPDALLPMITVSSNDATNTCVALLHRVGWLPHRLNARFASLGLPTLQLHHTTAQGGWRNADGSGVGHIHMTAWDTARLLWLLDAQAPPAPWLPAGTPPLLRPASRDRLRAALQAQTLNEVLSSGSLQGLPGWVPGGPDAPAFAHKTGTTDNYASDAGIVHTEDSHCIVALLSSLGRRYAPHAGCASTWRLPALGAAVQRIARAASQPRRTWVEGHRVARPGLPPQR
jgi:hypothetical protein